MAGSLGYILMNWTAEFARHSKAKKELKKKGKGKTNRETDKDATRRDLKSISEAINTAVQTEGNSYCSVNNHTLKQKCQYYLHSPQENCSIWNEFIALQEIYFLRCNQFIQYRVILL
jgi:hypothetical protein